MSEISFGLYRISFIAVTYTHYLTVVKSDWSIFFVCSALLFRQALLRQRRHLGQFIFPGQLKCFLPLSTSFLTMQNKPILLAIALAICIGTMSGCKKENPDPDGLVPATQEGKGTGDFLVNGVAFGPRPSISSPGSNPVGVTVYPGRLPHTRDFEFVFYRMTDRNSVDTFNLILNAATTPGTYL